MIHHGSHPSINLGRHGIHRTVHLGTPLKDTCRVLIIHCIPFNILTRDLFISLRNSAIASRTTFQGRAGEASRWPSAREVEGNEVVARSGMPVLPAQCERLSSYRLELLELSR
ncbi:hypothetical protein E2C01_069126 [Portunus trituberculatus]|uniref:Uncharacterized protein n=1 Tax=Portunus trituberculatus TaxID=210409 RepID=A0A5B7HP96_PORTR|nr:hypothetical protein [Portunus trituberculatus]